MALFPVGKGIALLAFATGIGYLGLPAIGRMNALKSPRQQGSTQPMTIANGWRISPDGTPIGLAGDMPATIIPLPDGKRALVNTCGYHDHSVNLIDIDTHVVLTTVEVGQAWMGMALSPSGDIFLSGGSGTAFASKPSSGANVSSTDLRASILHLKLEGDQISVVGGINLPGLNHFTSDLKLLNDGSLVAIDIQNDTVYKLSGPDFKVSATAKVGYRPYAVASSPDGTTLAVSNWGQKSITLLNQQTLAIEKEISVGSHPHAVIYGKDGRLFVANEGSDSVSVIKYDRVIETIRVSLDPQDPMGACPIALVLDNSDSRLYVANSGTNCVAVVDTTQRQSRVLGFIPTQRYPCAIAGTNDDRRLLIGTAKGLSEGPNVEPSQLKDPIPAITGQKVKNTYILTMSHGTVSTVELPNADQLSADTAEVRSNRPLPYSEVTDTQKAEATAAMKRIKHVIYVIKENRTYDQVFGDLGIGNGAPQLVMFGAKVTPNIHSLVRQYTLLDNLYCDGESSQVGHQWTDSAYCMDYEQKQMLLSYSGHKEVESDTRLSSSPPGYIWQDAKKHGKTARIYGEYLEFQEDHDSAKGAVKADPEKFGCSAAFEKVFARHGRDTEKVQVFIDEMKAAEKSGKWSDLMVMALNEDHTRGMSAGAYSPWAMVGSNDLAVGQLVDAVSHSSFWKDTAIFVIEDDAQDGPDHVEAHRTEGFVVSPFVKRGEVDSTHYTTASMLHAIEIILSLPPMTQYDRAANPLIGLFTSKPDFTPFTALEPGIDLNAKNPSHTTLADRSAKLDFTDLDRADPTELNAILWEAIHPGVPVPPPVHGSLQR